MKADQIEELLRDCGVAPGDPDRRRRLAEEVAGFAEVSDFELVCRYQQARADSLAQIPKLLVAALKTKDCYLDLLDLAIRWDRSNADLEPGAGERKENAKRDAEIALIQRQRQALLAFNLLFSGRHSPERARRELDPLPTESHFRTLVKEGAVQYGIPHPEIATEILLNGEARLLSLYLISHGPRPRKLRKSTNEARVAGLLKRYPLLAGGVS